MSYWWLLLPVGIATTGSCSPEVVIARDQPGAGTGGNASSGSGGGIPATSGTSGTGGDTVSGDGGDGGDGGENEGGVAGGGGSGTSGQPSLLLADSVADFDLEQGKRNWYYGFDNGTIDGFTLLPRTSVITAYVPVSGDMWDCWTTTEPHWTQIFQLGAHPNGVETSTPSMPVLERAVRRWISSYDGDIRIVGELAKIDVTPDGSNGIEALILVDNVEIYSTLIGGEDAAGVSYETPPATVRVDSTVDFVLDPLESDDHHDLTRFTAVIERAVAQSD